ncbi:endonuclease/exonuclease/phosphatase family protein [Flavimarina sp. Hel_I_48]|uniref:endonuclease/exonuclease/phosphatase family protein n=1 Tax=Flavimarina sp. Hel_I_48 TaxID=1392488 RepID=UPI0004DF52B1|nr:endonuclease/exonuclease/phosphatase family protein [Flavimarina sp. Hel_I_48]
MVLYYFAGFFILIALLPLVHIKHWAVRGWDYVRVQTSFLQAFVIFLILILSYPERDWQWGMLIGLIATLTLQIIIVIPYSKIYPVGRKRPKNTSHLKKLSLITANVLQDNREYDKFRDLIYKEEPDVFLTMETDKKWEAELECFEKDYPYTVKVPIDNYYGMHLYSKYKLTDTRVEYMVEEDVPSIFTKVHYRKGDPLNLICVHPAPPSPTENETSKERDAELLLAGKKVRDLNAPIVVCGDLNDVVWSRVSRLFRKMTGLIDPRIGRGLYPTFHAEYWYLRFPIDHMFHSQDIYVEEMRRLSYYGSDHFPMYFSLLIKNGTPVDTHPDLDKETEEEIEENIEEGVEAH